MSGNIQYTTRDEQRASTVGPAEVVAHENRVEKQLSPTGPAANHPAPVTGHLRLGHQWAADITALIGADDYDALFTSRVKQVDAPPHITMSKGAGVTHLLPSGRVLRRHESVNHVERVEVYADVDAYRHHTGRKGIVLTDDDAGDILEHNTRPERFGQR